MAITETKISFIRRYWAVAVAAAKHFGLNPVVLLAQAAQESGWGTSYSAGHRRNFFGILAVGAPNLWWDGRGTPSSVNPHLVFRVYDTDSDSFHDYARLISRKYPAVAALSHDIDAYAAAMAASDYIFEGNGDDRGLYRRNVAQFGHEIAAVVVNARTQRAPWVQVLAALLVAMLTMTGTSCVTYQRCVDKYGVQVAGPREVAVSDSVKVPVTVTTKADSGAFALDVDSLAAAPAGDTVVVVTAGQQATVELWTQPSPTGLRLHGRVKVPPQIVHDTVTRYVTLRAQCPPVVAFQPKPPWWSRLLDWYAIFCTIAVSFWLVLTGVGHLLPKRDQA